MVMPASCSGAMRTTWGSSQPLGVTPGQDRGFALAIAYRGYAGDCCRVTPSGAAMLPNPIPQPPRPDSAHWQACRRYPGLHGPKSACSLPAAEKVCGTAPVTLSLHPGHRRGASARLLSVTPYPSSQRKLGSQECATHPPSSGPFDRLRTAPIRDPASSSSSRATAAQRPDSGGFPEKCSNLRKQSWYWCAAALIANKSHKHF